MRQNKMKVEFSYLDKYGTEVTISMGDIVKVEFEEGKIVAISDGGARMVTSGVTLNVSREG